MCILFASSCRPIRSPVILRKAISAEKCGRAPSYRIWMFTCLVYSHENINFADIYLVAYKYSLGTGKGAIYLELMSCLRELNSLCNDVNSPQFWTSLIVLPDALTRDLPRRTLYLHFGRCFHPQSIMSVIYYPFTAYPKFIAR